VISLSDLKSLHSSIVTATTLTILLTLISYHLSHSQPQLSFLFLSAFPTKDEAIALRECEILWFKAKLLISVIFIILLFFCDRRFTFSLSLPAHLLVHVLLHQQTQTFKIWFFRQCVMQN